MKNLSLIHIFLYGYALFHHLSLDEQRKNITLYDINGEVLYLSLIHI